MATSDFDEYFALHAKGRFREAYAVLREIIKSKPRWSRCGDLYVWCADLELTVNDDVREAQLLLEKAHALGCRHPAPYHHVRGFVRWRMGDYDEGIRDLEKSVELEPSVWSLTALGKLLAVQGDERATSVWQRVLEQDPKNCLAYACLGMLAAQSGDQDRAILMVTKAEKLAASASDHNAIGRLYQELGQFQSAVDSFLKAAKVGDPAKAPLYAAIAACYFSMGDVQNGQEYLDRARRHDPDHEYVRYVHEVSRDVLDDDNEGEKNGAGGES